MPSDVYIFGYQSMLAQGSLATSIGGIEDYVPARLMGYRRDWGAVRDFAEHPRKRYVHTADWAVQGRVAFANLTADAGGWVNGLCHRIPADRLDELDFREQGYARVAVDGRLTPYPGHALAPGLPCYAYIDPKPDPQPAPVSRRYYAMGRDGAQAMEERTPGFAADYLATTAPPAELADDLAFIYIGADGRHLWLLDEADSSLVLLLRFARPQFDAASAAAPELDRPVSRGLEWLDLRGGRREAGDHPRIPAALARALTGHPDPASPCWLVRLAAVAGDGLDDRQLKILAADPDPWVRRAARLALGDPA